MHKKYVYYGTDNITRKSKREGGKGTKESFCGGDSLQF